MSNTDSNVHKCFACGQSFTVTFSDADADLKFCPHCGQETVDEIEILENYSDLDTGMLYDDED